MMVNKEKSKVVQMQPHENTVQDKSKINICVRKRPIFQKELEGGEIDCVSCTHPAIIVHECKYKVDGVSRTIDNQGFEMDHTFGETESTESLYNCSIAPQLEFLFEGGIVTCFAYGQTGSGKTFTMEGVQKIAVHDLFRGAEIMREESGKQIGFKVSYYEIYGGKVLDLLDNHKALQIQEDKNQQIQVAGLKEQEAYSPEEMLELISYGASVRQTQATVANEVSSRSHAICTITLQEMGQDRYGNLVTQDIGKLLLVDLAGSERAQDTQSNNEKRRKEGAEINQSLLALKECIRAMENKTGHIPFRQNKLTMALRDSFVGSSNQSQIIMLACVSPGKSSSDHTLNTLRYADRLKDKPQRSNLIARYMKKGLAETQQNFFPKLGEDDDDDIDIDMDDDDDLIPDVPMEEDKGEENLADM